MELKMESLREKEGRPAFLATTTQGDAISDSHLSVDSGVAHQSCVVAGRSARSGIEADCPNRCRVREERARLGRSRDVCCGVGHDCHPTHHGAMMMAILAAAGR